MRQASSQRLWAQDSRRARRRNSLTKRLFGFSDQRRAVDLQKTILINAPVGEVYAFWSLYENFPRFMSRVYEVRSSEERPMQSHWKVAGRPGRRSNSTLRSRAVPNQTIAWRTVQGSAVAHAGVVRFDPRQTGEPARTFG